MVQLEEVASAVEEADEVHHTTVLVQVQLDDTCCGESRSDASALTARRWASVTATPEGSLVFLKTSLNLNSLVHYGGEISKVMHQEC